MRILVTGGCGFIGSHFVESILKNTNWDIVVLDSLNYASRGFDRLRDINVFDDKRVNVLSADFTQPITGGLSYEIGDVDYIVHMGAETHVDGSIINPKPFVMSNVVGTYEMLEFAKFQKNLKMFVYFSTDEVFGPAPDGVYYKENDRYDSTNPYSATKAGGEELVMAYANTYQLPSIVTHTMNCFGERQHKEKFIPSTIRKMLSGDTVIIHSNSEKTRAGSRFYIHARNVSDAVMFLLYNGKQRNKYNIVGEREMDNLAMAQYISKVVDKPLHYEMVDFHSSRPGHDLRYALDGTKMANLGWKLPVTFEDSLSKTIEWTINHPEWLN